MTWAATTPVHPLLFFFFLLPLLIWPVCCNRDAPTLCLFPLVHRPSSYPLHKPDTSMVWCVPCRLPWMIHLLENKLYIAIWLCKINCSPCCFVESGLLPAASTKGVLLTARNWLLGSNGEAGMSLRCSGPCILSFHTCHILASTYTFIIILKTPMC